MRVLVEAAWGYYRSCVRQAQVVKEMSLMSLYFQDGNVNMKKCRGGKTASMRGKVRATTRAMAVCSGSKIAMTLSSIPTAADKTLIAVIVKRGIFF
jgi:hypothetical protein